jgi:hypothetical protein
VLYLNITKPNHLEKHPPPFEATHSNSGIHGDVKKKGKSRGLQLKRQDKQQLRYISTAQD